MRCLSIVLALMFIQVPHLQAKGYRFICNGILADGTERLDSCGVPCDNEHAARWSNPNIPVLVDYGTTPFGISQAQWRSVVKKSFAAWESVNGSNLRFVPVQGENKRDFGNNKAFHEIFWITDAEEWRSKIGVGEFGTLGATLTPYTCDENRQIVDSDMALNGLDHINWQIECNNEDCISPQTTLVHELGHFFGLDHPCQQCSDSIMSARAGLDIKYPLFDDMQGLRILYPDNQSGGFGSPCSSNADCRDDNHCLSHNNNYYCSHSCSQDNDCELGSSCQAHEGLRVCAFIDGQSLGSKVEGENCSRMPCEEPLICAGTSVDNSFCFMPCENNRSCKTGQECTRLSDENISICVNIKRKGERCFDTQLCEEHLFCVFNEREVGYCREACGEVNADTTECPSGESCELIDGRKELCIPLEQSLALGENSAGFAHNRGLNPRERAGNGSGCSAINQKVNDISFLVLLSLLLAFRLKRPKKA